MHYFKTASVHVFLGTCVHVSPFCTSLCMSGLQSSAEAEHIHGSSIKSGHVHVLLYPLFQAASKSAPNQWAMSSHLGGVGDDCQSGSPWLCPAAQTGKIDEQPLRSPLHCSKQNSGMDSICHHNAHVCPHTRRCTERSAAGEHRTNWKKFSYITRSNLK